MALSLSVLVIKLNQNVFIVSEFTGQKYLNKRIYSQYRVGFSYPENGSHTQEHTQSEGIACLAAVMSHHISMEASWDKTV